MLYPHGLYTHGVPKCLEKIEKIVKENSQIPFYIFYTPLQIDEVRTIIKMPNVKPIICADGGKVLDKIIDFLKTEYIGLKGPFTQEQTKLIQDYEEFKKFIQKDLK